ncbi:glycosyltransferase family 2 protein [Enterococcus mundtii]|uniref:glycosyltransferase family 2 protein n=1 Tax=Enterococcus TaxID=1350 RepID=UPI0032E02EB8|nr:glycosyltransferase family 2 protein [Enterococcus faecium]
MCEVSIIVPCYNVEPYLEMFIDSLTRQSFKDFEVLFVDDGSTDGTRIILNEFKKKDKRVHLILQENQGAGVARNNGLLKAKGKYVCFFDPDDIVEFDLLEESLKKLRDKKFDIYIYGIGYINNNGEVLPKRTTLQEKEEILICDYDSLVKNFEKLFYETSMFSPCNKIYSRHFLLDNNLLFPNNRTGQDSLFNIEVIKKMPAICITHEIYYYYRFNRKGSAARKLDKQRIKDDLAICHSFIKMTNELDLALSYQLNLNFQKYYKLTKRINQEKTNQNSLLLYLFSDQKLTQLFKLHKISDIYGKKNKLRFLYFLMSNYSLLRKGKL